jgi:tRNA(Ile)-lysidine synthase
MTSLKAHVSLRLERGEGRPSIDTNPKVALLDADKLTFPLTLRHWKQGDRFQPLGMKGEKLISDFLIQEKIEQSDKEKVLVLESDGQICWVVGMRVADEFKITELTRAYWRIVCE